MNFIKLSSKRVNTVRKLLALGKTQTEIAKVMNVDRRTIYNIKYNKKYNEVEIPQIKPYTNYNIVPIKNTVNFSIINSDGKTLKPESNGSYRLRNSTGKQQRVAVNSLLRNI